jgi:nucleoside-diphosphate-sugar epimerase
MGGATENCEPEPVGEYAQSCLGRERIFQYHAAKYHTPLLIFRLNYANDLTYGVLLEIARSVRESRPVDLIMGNVNVIWQGDANEMAIRALRHCATPPKILNVTGPETVSIRWVAEEFGRLFGQPPRFVNEEQPTALLNNAAECFRLFGYPKVSLTQMMELVVAWTHAGGKTLNKETHFQERKGKF